MCLIQQGANEQTSHLVVKGGKYKHGNHFHEQGNKFSLFVLVIEVILGKESQVLLKQLSQLMAKRLEE